ncbi:GNAT family N-acetyltransferase [Marinitenerispora sediminis]|uniref:GNAT family N-acetyltransferase n=1 Tax=Marinitenerispora sediminis TaxID=1931232 RepID=A0A368T610_9ACTN|nr:GNAT family N-acetyltransferase [Marinitenerispora sediminis]RCV51508.1 GNAT family N-acetyltransferase [Marinitenerispora sediminis]RCV55181.1 GNAT family N-acetyltransferase [Marinitenerispora sediminis]RCV59121.1 GNAT family N-acetyltransferase [Marinitenerispora sediminis]
MPRTDAERAVLTDGTGRPVLRFRRGERSGRPAVFDPEVVGPDPVGAILDRLPGWVVVAPVGLGKRLAARGAAVLRHAHELRRDLAADPPPAAWAGLGAGPGYRLTPCDRPAADLLPAWRAAYPAGHPDHLDGPRGAEELAELLAGRLLGPLLPGSGLAVERTGRVAAALLVHDWEGLAWVGQVFRDPAPAHAGLGALLLRRGLARTAADGWPAMGLAVSDGNPARGLYERLGFTLVSSALTVVVPGRSADAAGPLPDGERAR